MSEHTLYQEPDCGAHVPHEGECTLCGAVPLWVVPVEPDELVTAYRDGKFYMAILGERAYNADEIHEMLTPMCSRKGCTNEKQAWSRLCHEHYAGIGDTDGE